MSFLRLLSAWFNPTVVWEEDLARSLIVDLDENGFSGSRAGDAIKNLSFLGPGKVTPSGFAWPRKGIDVTVSDGRIQEIGFALRRTAEPDQWPFVGTFRYGGEPVRLSSEVNESGVQSMFGPPYWRDQDESEIILFYESPDRELQFELDLDGTLKSLRFGLPILADAQQRVAYGVTKPWPPDHPLPSSESRVGQGRHT